MSIKLTEFLSEGNETLGVEFKSWMETSTTETKAKLARHIAALANHGGGYLIFGVEDDTRTPQGEATVDRSHFTQDAISSIVKRYLDPPLQVLVKDAEHEGVQYPLVIIPSHGGRPVVATVDGPQDAKGKVTGINRGAIYIRAAGPESIAIARPDDWNALLDRCLSHRSDLLGNLFRQTIDRQAKPDPAVAETLRNAVKMTASSFRVQTQMLSSKLSAEQSSDRAMLANAGEAFSAMGYALVGADGGTLQLNSLRGIADRASVSMHQYAYYGWNSFLPLNVPERAPQMRNAETPFGEVQFLEGMRLENTAFLMGTVDYWRIYEMGMGISIESYQEDWSREGLPASKYLSPSYILVRAHSLLAHARFVGSEIGGVSQVIVRIDLCGLKNRQLQWNGRQYVAPGTLADDTFTKTITIPWAELRDGYFEALRRVVLPMFELFPVAGWFQPEQWMTPEAVNEIFERIHPGTLKLLEV